MAAILKAFFRFFGLVLMGASGVFGADELLSARCQAKCLHNFERSAKDKGLLRRQLKHTIIPLCKDDANCSSCAVPCREDFQTLTLCKSVHCLDAESKKDCEDSCDFLKRIYTFKPGNCPRPKIRETLECVSSCRRDGDCPDTQKCCSNGCGQSCSLAKGLSRSLLPIPAGVGVSERKRGRSAIVRWVMTALKPEHTSTHSNLYVVQWKWGVTAEESAMTRWQTITIRNKLYAILKHLLSPGRYYMFRVAAVSRNGSMGFSQPSRPFKLSKSPKAPSKPRNLNHGRSFVDASGFIIQEIHWLPPTSDLPIVHYQVSWSIAGDQSKPAALTSTQPIQNDMPQSSERNEFEYDERRENNGFTVVNQMTEIVPAEKNSVQLRNLLPNTRYLVEVNAIVRSDEKEIVGEKATIFVVPRAEKIDFSPTTTAENQTLDSDVVLTHSSTEKPFLRPKPVFRPLMRTEKPVGKSDWIDSLEVEKPFFQNGLLKATLTWDLIKASDSNDVPVRFEVKWWPTVCIGASYPEFSLTKPLSAFSEVSIFSLYDLQFGCHYAANVSTVLEGPNGVIRRGSGARISFETPLCQDSPVKGEIRPSCPTMAPDVPSPPQNLECRVDIGPIVTRRRVRAGHNVTAACKWDAPFRSDKPVTGYRVITGQKLNHHFGISGVDPFPSIDRNTVSIRIFKKEQERVNLHSLIADTEYIVQIQAISEIGLGPAIYKTFMTPSLRPKAQHQSDETSSNSDLQSGPSKFSSPKNSRKKFPSNENEDIVSGPAFSSSQRTFASWRGIATFSTILTFWISRFWLLAEL